MLESAYGGTNQDRKESKGVKGTYILESQREGRVRTAKESEYQWARGAHILESADRGTNEDSGSEQTRGTHTLENAEESASQDAKEGVRASQATHILESAEGATSENRERKKANERGALTNWRVQREEQVRRAKENKGARITHSLESAEGATN